MTYFLCILIKNAGCTINISFSKLNIDTFYTTITSEVISLFNHVFTVTFLFNFLQYVAIPFLFVVVATLLLLLIINRYYFEKLIDPKKKAEIKINGFLTEIIFSDYSITHIKEKINQFKQEVPFKKKWCKVMILNKIIIIKQNINGVNPTQILLIYKFFGFQHYSKRLIQNRKWHHKSLGIYHYQVLDYKIKKGSIKPYLKDKNKYLKSNALIALIALADEKFDFLNNYPEKISRADELKILDIIYQKKCALPKSINNWLSNPNSSIVILAIKLMVQYQKPLNISQIESLLSSPDLMIRKETLLAIRELMIMDTNTLLMTYYVQETEKRNKISCLKTFGTIGNSKTIDFLSGIMGEEKDLEIKFEIINCITNLHSSFFKNYKVNDQAENDIIKRIVLHVNNPYLN